MKAPNASFKKVTETTVEEVYGCLPEIPEGWEYEDFRYIEIGESWLSQISRNVCKYAQSNDSNLRIILKKTPTTYTFRFSHKGFPKKGEYYTTERDISGTNFTKALADYSVCNSTGNFKIYTLEVS